MPVGGSRRANHRRSTTGGAELRRRRRRLSGGAPRLLTDDDADDDEAAAIGAVLWTSAADLHGTGSTPEQILSGPTISFSLTLDGEPLTFDELASPAQLSMPLNDPDDALTACTGRPDPRQLFSRMAGGGTQCASTMECKFWSEPLNAWSKDGCETVGYNATSGGAVGCSCGHLREKDFIATKVPTDVTAADIELVTLDAATLATTHCTCSRGVRQQLHEGATAP